MRPENASDRVPAATVRCIFTVTCGEHFFLEEQRWIRISRFAPSLSVQVSLAPRLAAMWPLSGVDLAASLNAFGVMRALLIIGGVTSSCVGSGVVGASTVNVWVYSAVLSSASVTSSRAVMVPAPV